MQIFQCVFKCTIKGCLVSGGLKLNDASGNVGKLKQNVVGTRNSRNIQTLFI